MRLSILEKDHIYIIFVIYPCVFYTLNLALAAHCSSIPIQNLSLSTEQNTITFLFFLLMPSETIISFSTQLHYNYRLCMCTKTLMVLN